MLVSDGPLIDVEFVGYWSNRYSESSLEKKLLNEVHAAVAKRGYFTRDEFLEVGRWKSARAKTYQHRNATEDIEDVTRMALAAPERLAHRILDMLAGVNIPMASALLTVADPARFTITDFRALETLHVYREIGSKKLPYPTYLTVCRAIAERVGTNLRTLDRALWQWSKERNNADAPPVSVGVGRKLPRQCEVDSNDMTTG